MAQSFTLKVGSLDLSDYTRVGPDEGLDPYSDSFQDPIFDESASSEGQVLTGVNVTNRQQKYPLYLKGINKDALHDLVMAINREVLANGGKPVIEWKDAGASNSTFYDAEFVRFDPDYSFRRGQKGYLGGILNVWAQPPYGRAPDRGPIGTAGLSSLAVGQVSDLQVASYIDGDVKALTQTTVTTDATARPGPAGRIVGLAGPLTPSHVVLWPAAQLLRLGSASLTGMSGAVASQALVGGRYASNGNSVYSINPGAQVALPGNIYAGRQRIVAALRPGYYQGMYAYAIDGHGKLLAPTAGFEVPRDGYKLVDLGVVTVPSTSPTTVVNIGWGLRFDKASSPAPEVGGPGGGQVAGSLGALYILPEEAALLHVDRLAAPVAGGWFTAIASQYGATGPIYDDYGVSWGTLSNSNGVLLDTAKGLYSNNGSKTGFVYVNNAEMMSDFRAEAMIRTDTNYNGYVSSISRLRIGKNWTDIAGGNSAWAEVGFHGTAAYLSMFFTNMVASFVASIALPTTILPNGSLMKRGHLEILMTGRDAFASLRMIPEGATQALVGGRQTASVVLRNNATILGIGPAFPWVQHLTSELEVPWARWDRLSGHVDPGDRYTFDGINDRVLVQSTLTTADLVDRTANLRGPIPQLIPPATQARFTAFIADIDGDAMNDSMASEISIRERFFLAQ